MKKKLTVTIDQDLIPVAKDRARMEGVSLSELIENALRRVTAKRRIPFSRRWRGRFEPAGHEDERYRALAEKYL
jgi:hypothetical protein